MNADFFNFFRRRVLLWEKSLKDSDELLLEPGCHEGEQTLALMLFIPQWTFGKVSAFCAAPSGAGSDS